MDLSELVEQIRTGALAPVDAPAESDFYAAWQQREVSSPDPFRTAATGGALADRLAWVFIAGYQATLIRCFPTVSATSGWCALVNTEERNGSLPGTSLITEGDSKRLYGWKIAALIVGFGGVLMIVKPGLTLNVGHMVALAAAMLFAVSVTLTKYITRRDTALTVIFLMFTMQTVIGAIPAWMTWVWPPAHALPFVAVVALAGTVSHYCLSKAISLADATVVMPMDFLRLPLSALLGYWLYNEGLDAWSLAGGALIIAANTINIVKASRS